MVTRNRISGLIALSALLILAVMAPDAAYSQGDGAPLALQPGQLLILTKAGEFFTIDPTTGLSTPFFNLDLGTREAYGFIVDAEHQRIYVLTSPNCCQVSERGTSHVVEVDLRTGTSEIVFKKENLVTMHLLPGDRRISLAFYPVDVSRITGTEPIHECILDISSGVCADPLGLSKYEHINWLEGETFVGTIEPDTAGDRRSSYLVDLDAREARELPVVAEFVSSIPGGREVLLTNGIGAGDFTRLNLETLATTVFSVQGEYDPTREFYPVSFSPDGEYLLFSYDRAAIIVESGTGARVARLESLFSPQWLPDSTGLVAMTSPDLLNQTTLVLFSLKSQSARTITTLENVCSFVVLPDTGSEWGK
jgi:hypothetical protein